MWYFSPYNYVVEFNRYFIKLALARMLRDINFSTFFHLIWWDLKNTFSMPNDYLKLTLDALIANYVISW